MIDQPSARTQDGRLTDKYQVYRTDGRDLPGGDREHAAYFVLDYAHDEHAALAVLAYAHSVQAEQPGLAADLRHGVFVRTDGERRQQLAKTLHEHLTQEPWAFTPDDEGLSLEEAVYQAIGGASACWEHLEGAGVFREDRARHIAEALLAYLKQSSGGGEDGPA